jgi:hypothetical protein
MESFFPLLEPVASQLQVNNNKYERKKPQQKNREKRAGCVKRVELELEIYCTKNIISADKEHNLQVQLMDGQLTIRV